MAENGMYEITGFDSGHGGSHSEFRGTRQQAEARKAELDEEHPDGNWHIETTDFVGAYPRDDRRYDD